MENKLFLILAVVLLSVFIFSKMAPKSTGKKAPAIAEELLDGQRFELQQLRGQYILLDFWGSWCPPCRRDNPNLVKLYDKFNGRQFKKAEGFEIVSVALEKNDKRWQKAIIKDGLRWRYHILRTSRLVATDALAYKYGVKDLPTKFLIDPEGIIVGVNLSKEEIENILEEQLVN